MEVIVTEQDGIAIVELAGRMDATTTPEFENATRALLEAGNEILEQTAHIRTTLARVPKD